MNEYLKVGDWVQKEDGPWTEIVKAETLTNHAANIDGVPVNRLAEKTRKILRKGSVYVQKGNLGTYVILFERMGDTCAHGQVICPVIGSVRENVSLKEGKANASNLELSLIHI